MDLVIFIVHVMTWTSNAWNLGIVRRGEEDEEKKKLKERKQKLPFSS